MDKSRRDQSDRAMIADDVVFYLTTGFDLGLGNGFMWLDLQSSLGSESLGSYIKHIFRYTLGIGLTAHSR